MPSTPTSGAASAPTPNWTAPSSAAAVPADSPCRDIASAGAFGMTRPALASRSHSDASTVARPPIPDAAATTRAAPAVVPIARPVTRIRWGVNRRSSRTLTWVAAIRPTAPAPNASPNCCSERPYWPWNTNDEPET